MLENLSSSWSLVMFDILVEAVVLNFLPLSMTPDLDCSRLCLQRQSRYFHNLNIFHVRALDSAFDASISLQYWEEAHQHGLESLDAYR